MVKVEEAPAMGVERDSVGGEEDPVLTEGVISAIKWAISSASALK